MSKNTNKNLHDEDVKTIVIDDSQVDLVTITPEDIERLKREDGV